MPSEIKSVFLSAYKTGAPFLDAFRYNRSVAVEKECVNVSTLF